MPFKRLVRAARVVVRRFHAWRTAPRTGHRRSRARTTSTAARPSRVDLRGPCRPPTRRRSPPEGAPSTAGRGVVFSGGSRSRSRSGRTSAMPFVRRLAGDLYHGMAFMGIPVALGLGKPRSEARRLRCGDILPQRAQPRPDRGGPRAGSSAARARLGQAGVANRHGQRGVRRRDGWGWPVQRPLVAMNCSFRYAAVAAGAPLPRPCLGLDPSEKVVLYHGGLFPWRGIEQLIERPAGARRHARADGLRDPRATLKAWEADPATGARFA